jgi:hypothetical protein
MAGIWWRLLAAFSLILVAAILLRGQDAAVDRSAPAPIPAPEPYSPAIEPAQPPAPIGRPTRYPVARGTIALPQVILPQVVLPQIIRAAGIIFVGRVIFVERAAGRFEETAASSFDQGASSTTVTFQVENAIRGSSTGQNLTIHEWSGLWTRGERYRVGERVLLFLYAPSRLGLTSPVAGLTGRFAINPQGEIVVTAQNAASLAADPLLSGKSSGKISKKMSTANSTVPYADFLQAVRQAGREK